MGQEVERDVNLIAYCGLYCGACKAYKSKSCEGCHASAKAKWCKIRPCIAEHGYKSCADCEVVPNVKECRKYNNIFSRIIGVVLLSKRSACIDLIKEVGYEEYSRIMASKGKQTIRWWQKRP